MYLINKQANAISQLTQRSFSELGFREREHLQEWIAKEPSTLGEDLLIIQKEFDGFDDTREREFDGYNKAVWPEMINWMVQHIHQLEKAISQPLKESNQTLKTFSALPPPQEEQ